MAYKGAARAREGLGGYMEPGSCTDSRRGEGGSARRVRAEKPRAVADETDERARGVSGRAEARQFRSISSDRANAAAARFGPTDRGVGPRCAGRWPRRLREKRNGPAEEGKKRREEKKGDFGPGEKRTQK